MSCFYSHLRVLYFHALFSFNVSNKMQYIFMMRNILSFFFRKMNRKYIVYVCVHKFACFCFLFVSLSMWNWNQQSAYKEVYITVTRLCMESRQFCMWLVKSARSFAYRYCMRIVADLLSRFTMWTTTNTWKFCIKNTIRQTPIMVRSESSIVFKVRAWLTEQPVLIKCQLISDQSAAQYI